MEPHVHCFCSACLDIACDNAVSGAVIHLDGCGQLRVSHFFEEMVHWYGFACFDVESTNFGFSGTRHDGFEDLGDVEDGAIVRGVVNKQPSVHSDLMRRRMQGLYQLISNICLFEVTERASPYIRKWGFLGTPYFRSYGLF